MDTSPSSQLKIEHDQLKMLKKVDTILERQSFPIKGLFILAIFYTLYFTQVLVLPILISFLLCFLLYPCVNFLNKKLFIPKYIASAIVLLVFLIIIGGIFYYLSFQANEWINNIPYLLDTLNEKFIKFNNYVRKSLNLFNEITLNVGSIFKFAQEFNIQQSLISFAFTSTWLFFIESCMTLVLLYFLLASENFFLKKIIQVLRPKEAAGVVVNQIKGEVWTYLFARTAINIGVAIVVSLALFILGVPNPILWGVMVGTLEFIPFLGGFISVSVMTIVSIISFDNGIHIIAVPLSVFLVLSLEGNFIAPYVFGRSLVLNKVAIVLTVFLLGWIWGIVGTILAIPLMMTIKIILDNINENNVLSELFSE